MAAVIAAMREQHLDVIGVRRSPDRAPSLGIHLTDAKFIVEGSTPGDSQTAGSVVVVGFKHSAGVRRLAERLSIPSHGPSYDYRRGVAAGHLLIAERASSPLMRRIVDRIARHVVGIAGVSR